MMRLTGGNKECEYVYHETTEAITLFNPNSALAVKTNARISAIIRSQTDSCTFEFIMADYYMENSELITKALKYIQSETNKGDITIDDVASHAGFSTDYFNRIFFAHTGFTIMEYVRFSRLKKAARLLRTSELDILTIALDCGYEAHESFSRAFKNQYGISPSEYRKKYEKVEAFYGDFYRHNQH